MSDSDKCPQGKTGCYVTVTVGGGSCCRQVGLSKHTLEHI